MKKIGLVLGVMTILVLLAGVALADCEDDCVSTFETCLNLCRQTTEADSEEAGKCANHCMKGRGGCLKRCEAQNQKSENTGNCPVGFIPAGDTNIVLAANCIEKDLQCTLNGTPCCAPYECKGKFPIHTVKKSRPPEFAEWAALLFVKWRTR